MRNRSAARLAALVVAGMLLLAGCTGEAEPVRGPDAEATGAGGTESSASDSLPGEPSATATAEVFPPDADVLTVAIQEANTLDPMRISDPASELIARQLFEGLTAWDSAAQELVGAAAESWKASPDGRTFTFKLRPGMTFHNGAPVTSKNFEFAFDRIAQKDNASDLAYTLQQVEGFDSVNQLGEGTHLSGISTPDDATLVIKLSEPYQDFPVVLTHPGLVPLDPSAVRNLDEFLRAPVGNGPFQIAEQWSPGLQLTLKSFPGFIQTPDLDGIRFVPYADAAASWLPFINGSVDIAEVPAGQIETAAETFGDEGYQPFLAGYYYGFNLSSPALRNLKLRKAINRAIDRDFIAKSIYKETMQAPRGIVPEGMPGFDQNLCVKLCSYSPSAAKKLIADVPNKSRSVVLEFNQGNPHDEVAKAVKANLEDVGLDVTVRGYPFSKYLRRLSSRQQQMYRLGWIAEYPSPDVFLSSLFKSDSPDNHSGFNDSKVDKLLASAHSEPSANKRLQDYVAAEKAILKQVPIVPIGTFQTHWAAQKNVDGIVFDQMGGFDAVGISLSGR
jgi:peptide/nickel transport system substrate-binding protein/oligopeptide transport system substrate-binding protein